MDTKCMGTRRRRRRISRSRQLGDWGGTQLGGQPGTVNKGAGAGGSGIPTDNISRILIPLYNYPNWYVPDDYIWPRVTLLNSAVTAILNPASGPGTGADPNSDYIQGMDDLVAGGISMVGYVATTYGAKSQAAVEAEIDLWVAGWEEHGLSGIFFDEVTSDGTDNALYLGFIAYVKAQFAAGTATPVFINMGTPAVDEVLVAAADTTIMVEGTQAVTFEPHTPPAYVSSYDKSKFCGLCHTAIESGPANIRDMTQLNDSRGYGWVYITDDVLGNPWDTLPTFLEDMDDQIVGINAAEDRRQNSNVSGGVAPTAKAGLQMYLDIRSETADEGDALTPSDQHTSANDPTIPGGKSAPTYRATDMNGYPCIEFDADKFLACGGILGVGNGTDLPFTIIAVVKNAPGVVQDLICWTSSFQETASQQLCMAQGSVADQGPQSYRTDNVGTNVSLPFYDQMDNQPFVLTFRFTGTTMHIRVNGVTVLTAPQNVGAISANQVFLGAYKDKDTEREAVGLKLGAIAVHNTTLSYGDTKDVEKYLAERYGVVFKQEAGGWDELELWDDLILEIDPDSRGTMQAATTTRTRAAASGNIVAMQTKGDQQSMRLWETGQNPQIIIPSTPMGGARNGMIFSGEDEAQFQDGANNWSFQAGTNANITAIGAYYITGFDPATNDALLISHMGGDFNSWKHGWRWSVKADGLMFWLTSASDLTNPNMVIAANIPSPAWTLNTLHIFGFRVEDGVRGDMWIDGVKHTADFTETISTGSGTYGGHGEKWQVGGQPDPNGAVSMAGTMGRQRIWDAWLSDVQMAAEMDRLTAWYA